MRLETPQIFSLFFLSFLFVCFFDSFVSNRFLLWRKRRIRIERIRSIRPPTRSLLSEVAELVRSFCDSFNSKMILYTFFILGKSALTIQFIQVSISLIKSWAWLTNLIWIQFFQVLFCNRLRSYYRGLVHKTVCYWFTSR